MKSRIGNFEIVNPNPSVCYYNPNYNYLEKNVSSKIHFFKLVVPFKKKTFDKNNKYYLIQKLWRSYDVSSDYKTVQL